MFPLKLIVLLCVLFIYLCNFSLTKTANRFLLEKNKDHKLWKLENKQYHPYVTYNTVINNLDKQYDGGYYLPHSSFRDVDLSAMVSILEHF